MTSNQSAQPSAEPAAVRGVIFALSLLVVLLVVVFTYLLPEPSGSTAPGVLAKLNASLNASVFLCLLLGLRFVRRGQIRAHRAAMLTAFSASSLFLVSYLLHHAEVGSVKFQGQGLIKVVYYAVLFPHIVLAVVVLPLALLTIYRGWTGRVGLHKKIAKITLPIWLYVAASGVLVYVMLYHVGS